MDDGYINQVSGRNEKMSLRSSWEVLVQC